MWMDSRPPVTKENNWTDTRRVIHKLFNDISMIVTIIKHKHSFLIFKEKTKEFKTKLASRAKSNLRKETMGIKGQSRFPGIFYE